MLRRLLCSASTIKPSKSALLKNISTFVGIVTFCGVSGFAIGRWRRDQLDSIVTAPREITSDDFDPQGPVTEKVYLDISIDDKTSKRVIIGLYGYDTPNMVKHFGDLCDGIAYPNREENSTYHYLNTPINKVISGILLAGGSKVYPRAITNPTLNTSTDIAASTPPSNSNISPNPIPGYIPKRYKHVKFGCLTIAGDEQHMNTHIYTDFIITFRDVPLLDRNVNEPWTVIGQVLYAENNILQDIESIGNISGSPLINHDVRIVACGRLPSISKALEVNENEVLDALGKNINQIIR